MVFCGQNSKILKIVICDVTFENSIICRLAGVLWV